MSIKGVKLKSESFFSLSPGVLELWRKTLGGVDSAPPGPDRVKMNIKDTWPIAICLLFPNLEFLVKSDHPFLDEYI